MSASRLWLLTTAVAYLLVSSAYGIEETPPHGEASLGRATPKAAADRADDAAGARDDRAADPAASGDERPTEQARRLAEAQARAELSTNVDSLEALLKSLENKERDIKQLQGEIKHAPDEITREELLTRLADLKNETRAIAGQFEEFAVGVDTALFNDDGDREFDWQEELGGILRPILAEIENATAESRQIGMLREQINELTTLEEAATSGVTSLEQLLGSGLSPSLKGRLDAELDQWTRRRDDIGNQRTALELQLSKRLNARKSFLDSTTIYVQDFFRTRGLNLLMGIGAFALVFFGLRTANALTHRVRRSKARDSFATRLGTLLFQLASVVGGLLAMLLVFNMAGDWFLLGIIIILLLGLAWASINTLPQHIETVKLMLNVGPVREGERLVFDGVPWRVDSLNFSARLVNPLLDGGVQILPLRDLIGLHSRPSGKKEEWFPCRAGDFVELKDGQIGRVAYQTPGTVQVVALGGAQLVYPTPLFLELVPKTMSTSFRVTNTFGVGYKHQAICTTEIPEKMHTKVVAGLAEVLDPKAIIKVKVAFKEAAASSLDYEIDVDVDGAQASNYRNVNRAVARLLVEACNENGWEIPFQQIVVHDARAATVS